METSLYERPIPPERPSQGWPSPARWGVGIGIGCMGLVVAQAFLVWTVVGFIVRSRLPEGLKAAASVPATVTVGEKFPLSLTVTNGGSKPFTVGALILRKADQQKFTLADPQPAPQDTSDVYRSKTWVYQKSLAPGEKWTVKFNATAREVGAVNGSLDLQVGFLPKSVPFKLESKPNLSLPPARKR